MDAGSEGGGQDGGCGGKKHGSDRPARPQAMGQEYGGGQRQEDAAAPQRHGEVVPEEHLGTFVEEGEACGKKHDEKHRKAI